MKYLSYIFFLAIVIGLSSFGYVEKNLIGTWRYVHVLDPKSGDKMTPNEMLSLLKDIKMEFREDSTCLEWKSKSDGRWVSNQGEWKLENKGEALSVKMKEKWSSMKIIDLSNDTLKLELAGGMLHWILVREK